MRPRVPLLHLVLTSMGKDLEPDTSVFLVDSVVIFPGPIEDLEFVAQRSAEEISVGPFGGGLERTDFEFGPLVAIVGKDRLIVEIDDEQGVTEDAYGIVELEFLVFLDVLPEIGALPLAVLVMEDGCFGSGLERHENVMFGEAFEEPVGSFDGIDVGQRLAHPISGTGCISLYEKT